MPLKKFEHRRTNQSPKRPALTFHFYLALFTAILTYASLAQSATVETRPKLYRGSADTDCARLLTLEDHIRSAERSIRKTQELAENKPTDSIRLKPVESRPRTGPRAFQALHPTGAGFPAVPDPNAEIPVVAARKDYPGTGYLNMAVNFEGKQTSTDVYYLNPHINSENLTSGNLVNAPRPGEKPKIVVWRMHGGGTPNAVAMNASSTAFDLNKYDVATIAITQPGHGNATDAPSLMEMEKIIYWNLQAQKQLIHPDVKIVVDGHSWGGMFALAWHRISNRPEFKQIVGFIAESPAVVTGDSIEERMEGDEKLQKEIEEIRLGLRPDDKSLVARTSTKDLKFVLNSVLHGKVSPRAAYFTLATWFGYNMSMMSESERQNLKPLLVFMGKNDALCFVGREEKGLEYFKTFAGERNVHILGPGFTFDGPTDQTGHQIADNRLKLPSGEVVPYVNYMIWQFIQEHVPGAQAKAPVVSAAPAEESDDVADNDGKKRSKKDKKKEKEPYNWIRHATAVNETLIGAYLLYQNNFAARSYINHGFSYYRARIPGAREDEYQELGKRKEQILAATKQYERIVGTSKSDQKKWVLEKIRDFTRQYKVPTRFDLKTKAGYLPPLRSAIAELNVEMSPAREAVLATYMKQMKEIRLVTVSPELSAEYKHNYDTEIQTIAPTISRDTSLDKVTKMAKALFYLGRSVEEQQHMVEQWPTIWMGIDRGSPTANDEYKKELQQMIELSKKKKLTDAVQVATITHAVPLSTRLQGLWQQYNQKLEEVKNKKIQEMKLPEGTTSPQMVGWEFLLYQHPEGRREEIQKFADTFLEYLKSMRKEARTKAEYTIQTFQWPDGIHSLEEAQRELNRINRVNYDTYADYEGAKPEVKQLAAEIENLQRETAKMDENVRLAQKLLADLIAERNLLIKSIEELVKFEEDVLTQRNPGLRDSWSLKAESDLWSTYRAFKQVNEHIGRIQGQQMGELMKNGRPLSEAATQPSPALLQAQNEYEKLRADLQYRKIDLHLAILHAISTGQYVPEQQVENPSSPATPEAIQMLLRKLIGDTELLKRVVSLDPNSLEAKIQNAQLRLNDLQRERGQKQNELQRKQYRYSIKVPENERYFTTYSFNWAEVLNMEWPELIQWFNDPVLGRARLEAFQKFIGDFNKDWSDYKTILANNKKLAWYNIVGNRTGSAAPDFRLIVK